jgi:predicted RNA-binding Zn-ribbon protein involved in translation (DUF1610 family)
MKPIEYVCRHCGKKHTIWSFWQWFTTPHLGSKKLLRCERCFKTSYMERKDWRGPKWLDWYKDFF